MGANFVPVRTAIEGVIRSDLSTKRLLRSIRPGEIAVIRHRDLDETAAQSLLEAQVRAVINASSTMSGAFPHEGPLCLLRAGVPIVEIEEGDFYRLVSGSFVRICEEKLVCGPEIIPCDRFSYDHFVAANRSAEINFMPALLSFVQNTIAFAEKEIQTIIEPIQLPRLVKPLKGAHALIVARGKGFKDDLAALRDYIMEAKPVLVGVDGGADAFMEIGLEPDLIIGDMDSVTDRALYSGAQLLVHAYADGRAPGMERISELGLHADRIAAPGTSEDAALRLAYELEAARIILVGSHSHPIDFMEKGRAGMASTLLVRMMLGDKLVDAKGAGLWFPARRKGWNNVAGAAPPGKGGSDRGTVCFDSSSRL